MSRGDAAAIAAALGGAQRSGSWWRCRCPAHGSKGSTLALRDGDGELVVHCHGGCARRDVLDALRRRGLIGFARTYRDPQRADFVRPSDHDDAVRRVALARQIWQRAGDIRGTPAEAYLQARGITLASLPCLRWCRSLRRPNGTTGPAMVARIDDSAGRLAGIHRTWLERDAAGRWVRRDRAMLGRTKGGSVRLGLPAAELMVAEGIETAASAMMATTMPAWAALSAGGLESLILPSLPVASDIVILADNDRNGRGEDAAHTAAKRWMAEGRRVRIAMPTTVDSDWNDVLRGHACA